MQLQKRLSRAYKGKEYPKWIITIPPKLVKLLGWKEGQELEAENKGSELILKKKERSAQQHAVFPENLEAAKKQAKEGNKK